MGPGGGEGDKILRQTAKIILFNIVAVILICLSFELFTRASLNKNTPFKERFKFNVKYVPSGFVRFFPSPNQVIYEVENGIIKYNKIKFKINQYGFRGEDFPINKTKDEVRIFILGGSHVFDLNSFDYEGNYGFPYIIQKYFIDNGYNLRVINAGIPGDDTRNYFIKIIMDIHRYKPDIIIINSIWNDTKWISRTTDSTLLLSTEPAAFNKNPMIEKVNFLDKALGFSVLYRKFRDFYWKKKLHLGQNKIINEGIVNNQHVVINNFNQGFEQYRINLIAAVKAIQSINAIPILAIEERFISSKNNEADKKKIQYHFVNAKSHDELLSIFRKCDTIIEEIAYKYNISLINIDKEMEGNSKYFVDHVHTTPEGSEYIAEKYYNFLKPFVDNLRQHMPIKENYIN